MLALLVKIETSMSCKTLADSTLAQFGELGVNRLFLAAAAKIAGSPLDRLTSEVEVGMTPPTVTIWLWHVVRTRSLIHSRGRAWCWLLAGLPRRDPPRN